MNDPNDQEYLKIEIIPGAVFHPLALTAVNTYKISLICLILTQIVLSEPEKCHRMKVMTKHKIFAVKY